MKDVPTTIGCTLARENAVAEFRGEKYDYVRYYYIDEEGDTFTTTLTDTVSLNQIYNQYRFKYGIPFPDDILRLKNMYGINNATLTAILGFGENQIANYINGEVPSKANGKVLAAIKDAATFERFVDNAKGQLNAKIYERIKEKLKERKSLPHNDVFDVIYGIRERDIYNGYAYQDASLLKEVIVYILTIIGDTYESKMNKLLFYCDMLSYKETGMGMTGLSYMANRYGTIPFRSSKIYPMLDIPKKIIFDDKAEYSPYCIEDKIDFKLLSDTNKDVIRRVCEKFKNYTSGAISEENHKESVYERYKNTNKPIPFNEAFALINI